MALWPWLLAGILAAGAPHVRAEDPELRALVADTASRSATFRQLLDRLERSDVLVYVRTQHFLTTRLDGRIGFASGTGRPSGLRILLIELACPRSSTAQAETLAHELHHATEIADAPWVRDTATLARYYRQIGETAVPQVHGLAFETLAAQVTAQRVKLELSTALKLAHEDR